ncbi:uncharacterized protein LOC131958147 [Physella acuta]|uniref:uncharacterized protein LOC131958147 n=1 Tax=Physella acuta TaxID=109671 RepID=UPI0027DBF3B8|nr:uncharacterized protein LOC131958147 [Physella acuta]
MWNRDSENHHSKPFDSRAYSPRTSQDTQNVPFSCQRNPNSPRCVELMATSNGLAKKTSDSGMRRSFREGSLDAGSLGQFSSRMSSTANNYEQHQPRSSGAFEDPPAVMYDEVGARPQRGCSAPPDYYQQDRAPSKYHRSPKFWSKPFCTEGCIPSEDRFFWESPCLYNPCLVKYEMRDIPPMPCMSRCYTPTCESPFPRCNTCPLEELRPPDSSRFSRSRLRLNNSEWTYTPPCSKEPFNTCPTGGCKVCSDTNSWRRSVSAPPMKREPIGGCASCTACTKCRY